MNKSESKYFNTARLMDEAFISLLEKKDFKYITVKEICEKAGVNRSTFYLHYETIADLLAESMELINKQFIESFNTTPDIFISKIENASLNELVFIKTEFLRPYLEFIKEHKNVLKAAYMNPACMQVEKQLINISKYVLIPIMKRFHVPEKEHTYWISFYIHGIMAVIQEWVNENCKDSIEALEKILIHCIRPEYELQNIKYEE